MKMLDDFTGSAKDIYKSTTAANTKHNLNN